MTSRILPPLHIRSRAIRVKLEGIPVNGNRMPIFLIGSNDGNGGQTRLASSAVHDSHAATIPNSGSNTDRIRAPLCILVVEEPASHRARTAAKGESGLRGLLGTLCTADRSEPGSDFLHG